jgi:hypothetical protein
VNIFIREKIGLSILLIECVRIEVSKFVRIRRLPIDKLKLDKKYYFLNFLLMRKKIETKRKKSKTFNISLLK